MGSDVEVGGYQTDQPDSLRSQVIRLTFGVIKGLE